MLGKLTLTPSQLNTDYLGFVKTHRHINVIYKHPLFTLTHLCLVIPLPPHTTPQSSSTIRNITTQIHIMESHILQKWKCAKHPVYCVRNKITHFLKTTLPESPNKLVVTVMGLWESRDQYGLILYVNSI